MDFQYSNNKIEISEKTITTLDRFVFEFTTLLRKYTDFVIVSGYVSIIFGRARGTEDIDILIPRITKQDFSSLYSDLANNEYYFINPENVHGLFEMLDEGLGIRAAKKETIIPNIELKFVKDSFDIFSLKKRKEVVLNKKIHLFIAPLELQIPYKLHLGSVKDIEDAVYLWDIFHTYIDMKELKKFMNVLNVDGKQYGISV